MKQTLTTLVLLLTLLLSPGCVRDTDFRIPSEERKVALSCILTNSDVQKLTLTYSRGLRGGRFFTEVPQATVTLYAGETPVGSFSKVGYGEWELNYRPVAGQSYRIQAEIPQGPTLRATTTMPGPVAITYKKRIYALRTKTFVQRRIDGPFWIFCLESSLTDPKYAFAPPALESDTQVSLYQEVATDHPDVDHFNEQRELSTWDPDRLGLDIYKYYIRIAPSGPTPRSTILPFVIQHPYKVSGASFVVFRSASTEYDRYLRSVIEKMSLYESDDDPGAWFDQVASYSNVEQGVGIFAAYHQSYVYYNNLYMRKEPKP